MKAFGSNFLSLVGKEASKDKMLWPLQCWLFSWGCRQDTLWSSPGHPVVHCPIHPQHRWSSLKTPVAPSASQQRPFRPFWTPRLVKIADTPHAHKGELCHLSETQQQLRVLWRVSAPSGCWTDRLSADLQSLLD